MFFEILKVSITSFSMVLLGLSLGFLLLKIQGQ